MTDRIYLLLVLLLVTGSACGDATDDDMFLDELAADVYLHRGQIAALDDPARGDSANLGVVIGAKCIAVIDSGGAVATGVALLQAIRRISALPVCYVINTHVHFDHVLGNSAFVAAATKFVGHQALAEAITANREFFAESFNPELGGGAQAAARVIGPDTLVESRLELDLGQRRLLLEAFPRAHTTTDLTVHDVTSDTLFTGDLLFRERMPVLDGSLLGWLQWMERVMGEPHALVVPGHGAPDRGWPQGARAQHRYLSALLNETRAAIARGLFIDEAKEQVAVDERGLWPLSKRAHPLNVSRAFRELEWE